MLSYQQIADMTATTVDKVRSAVDLAETIDMPYTQDGYVAHRHLWFVDNPRECGYANVSDRYNRSIGVGKTRQEAVIMALREAPRWL